MPQLDFATYASQIFWLAVIFTILYVYLAKGPLPVIVEVLNNRQSRIASDLEKAESLKREAELAEEDFTSAISEARKNASELLNKAKAKAASEEAIRTAKIEQTFVQQSKEAEQRVVSLRKEATEALIPVAAQSAIDITEKLVGAKVDLAHAKNVAAQVSKELELAA